MFQNLYDLMQQKAFSMRKIEWFFRYYWLLWRGLEWIRLRSSFLGFKRVITVINVNWHWTCNILRASAHGKVWNFLDDITCLFITKAGLKLVGSSAKWREKLLTLLVSYRSALRFVCGIFVFGVTWILLGRSSEESISPGMWKQFMVSYRL